MGSVSCGDDAASGNSGDKATAASSTGGTVSNSGGGNTASTTLMGGAAGTSGAPSDSSAGGAATTGGNSATTAGNDGDLLCAGFPEGCYAVCEAGDCECHCEHACELAPESGVDGCGECYSDAHCAEGERCYEANCGLDGPTAGNITNASSDLACQSAQ